MCVRREREREREEYNKNLLSRQCPPKAAKSYLSVSVLRDNRQNRSRKFVIPSTKKFVYQISSS